MNVHRIFDYHYVPLVICTFKGFFSSRRWRRTGDGKLTTQEEMIKNQNSKYNSIICGCGRCSFELWIRRPPFLVVGGGTGSRLCRPHNPAGLGAGYLLPAVLHDPAEGVDPPNERMAVFGLRGAHSWFSSRIVPQFRRLRLRRVVVGWIPEDGCGERIVLPTILLLLLRMPLRRRTLRLLAAVRHAHLSGFASGGSKRSFPWR